MKPMKPAGLLIAVALIACISLALLYGYRAPAESTDPAAVYNQYDPDRDYFAHKISLQYAKGFTVEYHQHYKLVHVLNPWRDADQTFTYILVQKGTPPPENSRGAQVIEIPIERIAVMSTTYLPHLSMLGVAESLVGISDFYYVNTPVFVDMIKQHKVVKLGFGAALDLERMLALNPDLVMTAGFGDPGIDGFDQLREAQIPIGLNADYMEVTPLGRTEWLKFTALFFNKEKEAEELFAAIATEYEAAAAIAKGVDFRPTVFSGIDYGGSWHMPGGDSYMAAFMQDAGAHYLWEDDASTGSQRLDFETVYHVAGDADFWIHTGLFETEEELRSQDRRYAAFAALQNSQVYNNNKRLNANKGNDYFENGIANPHIVLKDLIAIFHPELLPVHELVFYKPLEKKK